MDEWRSLFSEILKYFIHQISFSLQKPAILFMDNQESHLEVQVLDIAKSNELSILTFPPHTSHRLRPHAVSVYGLLKAFYKRAVNDWNITYSEKQIILYDLLECFSRAFHRSMTPENITANFKKIGIWPLNLDVFSLHDFLPATVFDEPSPRPLNAETGGQHDREMPLTSSKAINELSFCFL